jgi:NADPH:quinone reductase-like Zn-dependent oxidoreductase
VKSLGAHAVIDYTRTDFTQTGQTWDVIFDAVGTRSFGQCRRALAPRGIYMNTVPTLGLVRDLLWTRLRGGKRAGFTTAGLKQNCANLDFLRELAETGHLRAVIDRCYPLDEIVQAHRYVETKRKKGNVVITLVG